MQYCPKCETRVIKRSQSSSFKCYRCGFEKVETRNILDLNFMQKVGDMEIIQIAKKLEILGNGDMKNGVTMLEQITDRLTHARTKHPHFADDLTHAVHLLQDEGDEVTKALFVETDERVIDETLDVIAVGVRLLGGEYTKKTNED